MTRKRITAFLLLTELLHDLLTDRLDIQSLAAVQEMEESDEEDGLGQERGHLDTELHVRLLQWTGSVGLKLC